jgi:iron complex transport system ATP-binding protein
MIKAARLSFFYETNHVLFENLSFELGKHETLAVLGPNGAGKTTLLRCLMGFLKPKSGAVHLDGVDGGRAFWRRVSYVPQARQCVFGYSTLNMVMMGRTPYIGMGRLPSKTDREMAMDALERLGLAGEAEKPCGALSGGQLQLALIARALVKSPSLLIMDEPESNLDMRNQLVILDLVRRLSAQNGIAVILNTHFPAHALRTADKAILLGRGKHIAGGTSEVITEENIAGFFGVRARLVDVESPCGGLRSVVPMEVTEL